MTEVCACILAPFMMVSDLLFRLSQVLVPFINSLVVLDMEGDRLFAKYYDGRKKTEQIANEAMLYKKTKAVSAKSEGTVNNPFVLAFNCLFSYLLFSIFPS